MISAYWFMRDKKYLTVEERFKFIKFYYENGDSGVSAFGATKPAT